MLRLKHHLSCGGQASTSCSAASAQRPILCVPKAFRCTGSSYECLHSGRYLAVRTFNAKDASSASTVLVNASQSDTVDGTPLPEATKSPAQPSENPQLTAEEAEARRQRLWKAAIKLPMYSVGYIPVLVGGAAVFAEAGVAPLARLAGFAFAAVCVIAWLNLSNDAFDAQTGVDESKPESVVNLTGGNRDGVLALSLAFLVVGVGLLAWLTTATGDGRVLAMLAASIAAGYMYQGPPFRLSYKGLGEPLCFLAFGPSATPAFYLALQPLQAAAAATATAATAGKAVAAAAAAAAASAAVMAVKLVPEGVWAASVLVGATTTIILFTSHFHQIEGDTKAGKRSPLVRLGVEKGLRVLQVATVGVYVVAQLAAAAGWLPAVAVAATAASLPAAKAMLDYAVAHRAVPAKIALLKRFACYWHIAYGASLAGGLVLARVLAGQGAVAGF